MRVLVTNDDGIDAPGLHALAWALHDTGADVVVAAPAKDYSGMSAALGPLHVSGRIDFSRVSIPGIDCEAAAVDGPPALCVLAACLGGFGPKPDIVVSGINAGANTGRAILHSGTVGAALTGLNFGVPGLAVSQVVGPSAGKPATTRWPVAAALAASLVDRVRELEPATVINLNVPDAELADIRGPVRAELDRGGTVQSTMVEAEVGVLELRVANRAALRPGSDNALLADGFATITALAGPHSLASDLGSLLDSRVPA